jgi:mycothiol S-conjugate amidase
MWARARWFAIHEAILAAGMESPFTEWIERMNEWPDRDDRITTRVECGDWFEIRDDALRAHATQVDPEGFWFKAPMDIQRKVWPTEDYELVRSFVDSPVPEDDLFTGVAETVRA